MSVRAGHDYSCHVRVGDHVWDIAKGDAPDYGPMAPMSIGWKFPDDGLFPCAPEPTNLQLSLVVHSAADLADVDTGTTVHVQVFLGITDGTDPLPSVVFAGRVAQRDGYPARVNGDDAFVVELSCMDYVADLGEREVAGYQPLQGVGVQTWMDYYFRTAGLPELDWNFGGWGQAVLVLNGGRVEPQSLYAAADGMLSTYADGGEIIAPYDESNRFLHDAWPTQGWRRGVITPVIDQDTGELDPATPYRVNWFSRRNTVSEGGGATSYPLFLRLNVSSGLYQLDVEPVSGSILDVTQVISADYLDFAARWKRTKNSSSTTVIVANNTPDTEYVLDPWDQAILTTTEDRPQIATRVTDFLGYQLFNAEWTTEMLLPDPTPYKDTADGFTWYASSDPSWPLIPSWFPGTHQLWFGFSVPILLTDIPATQSPASERGWYAGRLGGATFTIEPGGTWDFQFQLIPGAPMPGGISSGLASNYATCTSLLTTAFGCKPNNLDPTITVHDIRLLRAAP